MQEKKISTAVLKRPFDVSSVKIEQPYACLVYSAQKDVTNEEMEKYLPGLYLLAAVMQFVQATNARNGMMRLIGRT